MKKQILLLVLAITGSLFATTAHAQLKLGTNPTTINAGSILEMESATRGMLMPRVPLTTTTTWAPIAGSPAAGMTVYNITAGITSSNTLYPANGIGEYFWDGTGWISKKAGSQALIIGKLPFVSISSTVDGQNNTTFIIPVDRLLPSDSLVVTYSFYTDNAGGGNSSLVYLIPGQAAVTVVGDTGPCGGATAGGYIHRTITLIRPTTTTGMQLFQLLPNSTPGCQSQNIRQANILVQPK